MKTPAVDMQARKLLLLTRIAAERQELTSDLREFRHAASLPAMLRSAIGPGFLGDLLGKKRGSRGSGSGGWLGTAMTLLQRYRVAATVVGSLLPLFRRRQGQRRRGGGLRRMMLLAVIGGAAFTGWKLSRPGIAGEAKPAP